MISAPYLEVAVLVLGAIILLVESFASQLDRRFLAYAALCGLGVIFLATFFVAPQSSVVSAPFWNFYSADALSLFFKRIALATTAGVLVMMLDLRPRSWLAFPPRRHSPVSANFSLCLYSPAPG